MAGSYSNQLKVVFALEDLCEMSAAILRANCFTVQHFHYRSQRSRDDRTGVTLSDEQPSLLDFTIRIDTPDCGKRLLEQMHEHEVYAYTFLFNATFKETGRLWDYEDALVAQGCIVDIQEVFTGGDEEQMLMQVQILLRAITFVGKEHNIVLDM